MVLILVRHGETSANREGMPMSGGASPSLNAMPRAQAADIAAARKSGASFRLNTGPARPAGETVTITSRRRRGGREYGTDDRALQSRPHVCLAAVMDWCSRHAPSG